MFYSAISLFLNPFQSVSIFAEPGTEEAHAALWGFKGTTLELTYNHGTEDDPEFKGVLVVVFVGHHLC